MPSVPPVEFAELARLAEGDQDPASVLRRIVDHALSLVPGCTAAGLTVAVSDEASSVAVTDPRVERCHAEQFRPGGAGPGQEALRFGEPRRVDDLDRETRWPAFVRVARENGFGSCLALPLASDRDVSSALVLYAAEPHVFAGTTFDVALLFAAQGGVALDNAELYRRSREMAQHLHQTLTSRGVIERAKGLLMHQLGLDSEAAFDLLRRRSQEEHRKLRDVAWDLVRKHDPGGGDTPWTPVRGRSAPKQPGT